MELYEWESATLDDVKEWMERGKRANGDSLEYARFTGAMLAILPSVLRTIERLTRED